MDETDPIREPSVHTKAPDVSGQQPPDVPLPPAETFPVVEQRPYRVGLERRLTLTVEFRRDSRISFASTPVKNQVGEANLLLQGIEKVLKVNEKGQPEAVEVAIELCVLREQGKDEEMLLSPGSVLRVRGGETTNLELVDGELEERTKTLLTGALALPDPKKEHPPLATGPHAVGVPWEVDAPAYLAAFNTDPRVELAPENFDCKAEIKRVVENEEGRSIELRLSFTGADVSYTTMPEQFTAESATVSGRFVTVLPLDPELPETRREVRFRLKLVGTMPVKKGGVARLLTTFHSTSTRSYRPVD